MRVFPDPSDPGIMHEVPGRVFDTDHQDFVMTACGKRVLRGRSYLTDDEQANCLWCVAVMKPYADDQGR